MTLEKMQFPMGLLHRRFDGGSRLTLLSFFSHQMKSLLLQVALRAFSFFLIFYVCESCENKLLLSNLALGVLFAILNNTFFISHLHRVRAPYLPRHVIFMSFFLFVSHLTNFNRVKSQKRVKRKNTRKQNSLFLIPKSFCIVRPVRSFLGETSERGRPPRRDNMYVK